ncbi:MAG: HAMP domain-containing protein [Acidobacteria bacterium]|nr:HAMP domain-containing protein [Acidobacteriota bacterium]
MATPTLPRAAGSAASAESTVRRPFRDNPRLILLGILLLLAALASLVWLANRSARLSPDFLTGFVLYALSATNVMMLLALGFFLARNVVKIVVERRRALPFARFRAKLVALLLGLTLVPAVLVLAVGSQVVLTAVDRWFNAPMDEVLASASRIASDYYLERQRVVSDEAVRMAQALSRVDLADVEAVRAVVSPDVTGRRVALVQVYRVADGAAATPVLDVANPSLPAGSARSGADRLAARAIESGKLLFEPVPDAGGELLRVAQAIRAPDGRLAGVVLASDVLTGEMADRARRMTKAYEDYTQLRVLKQPLAGVYLSFFVMVTLLILVGSTWMGLYLAKRITRPVQMLSAAAREIGAGRLEHRIEHQADDEFGHMVESFNAMAADLATRQRRLERASLDLEQRHQAVERRHRSVETILERIATGVISIDAAGRVGRVNSAAARLLGLPAGVEGRPVAQVLGPDLTAVTAVLDDAARARSESVAQEVSITCEGREVTLAVAATRLHGAGGFEGTVLVLDDVTPLIRAQKVAAWREVARRLAHEIKNPLTPIQLSAERLQRKLGEAGAPHEALVRECTSTIIAEVESLKGLVDEFSQFARMPAPKAVPSSLNQAVTEALTLYRGLFPSLTLDVALASDLPPVRLDDEQIKRVIINLVDNAVEAMHRQGRIVVETAHDPVHRVARVVVADDGPGIPEGDRDKLFLPYYSTKGRGSGLGLAIVRRIVAEHGGNVEVSDNSPTGSRFTIELPC